MTTPPSDPIGMRICPRLILLASLVLCVPACGDDSSRCVDDSCDAVDAGAGSDAVDAGAGSDSADAGVALDSGGDALDTPADTSTICEATFRYDPLVSPELELWPDDRLTRPDATTPTGIRLDITLSNAPWVEDIPPLFADSFEHFDTRSGFAVNGGVFMRFTAGIAEPPSGWSESLASETLIFVDLGVDPPERVAYAARLADEGRDLFVDPLVPLRLATRHAVVLTRGHRAESGGCIAPSALQERLFRGDSPSAGFDAVTGEIVDALDRLELDPRDVVGLTVFTTHDDLAVVAAAAARARSATFEWVGPGVCVDAGAMRRCELEFDAIDLRDPESGDIGDLGDVGGRWRLPVSAWLPAELRDGAAAPVIVYGHGLGSDRGAADRVAGAVVDLGVAVVAVDALLHGDHPIATDDSRDMVSVVFLGIDLSAFRFDPARLRGNFNQSTLDRIQLVELMRQHPDLDGDGDPDVDTGRLAYWGISLGALLGSSFVALEGELGAAILSVGGGKLIEFFNGADALEALLPFVATMAGSEERLQRLMVVLQTLMDAGDPATFAPHIVRDRLSEADIIPNILLPVSTNDTQVPPASGRALARALGVPHLAPAVVPVESLEIVEGPLRGNIADGAATGAYFEHDRVSRGESVVESDHNRVPLGPEGRLQAVHLLQTWLDEGVAEIIDPYAELETPPLEH